MSDADTVQERVRKVLTTQEKVAAETAAILEPFLASAYGEALARAEHAWRSARYAELLTNLSRLFGTAVIIESAAGQPAKDVLPVLVGAELTGVAKFLRKIATADGSEELDRVMHRLRLATKRARYIILALRPIHTGRVDKLARDLKRLQSLLGERHDSTITRRFLTGLLEAEPFDEPDAALIERPIGREKALTATLDEKMPPAARKVMRRRDALNG